MTVPSAEMRTDFEAHHALHPLVGHADDAQQAELAPALEDRERERVDDPDQRDDDAHQEQAVDGVDEEVEDPTDRAARRRCPPARDVRSRSAASASIASLGVRLRVRLGVDERDGRRRVAHELVERLLVDVAADLTRAVERALRGSRRPSAARTVPAALLTVTVAPSGGRVRRSRRAQSSPGTTSSSGAFCRRRCLAISSIAREVAGEQLRGVPSTVTDSRRNGDDRVRRRRSPRASATRSGRSCRRR